MPHRICRIVGHDWMLVLVGAGWAWYRCRRCRGIQSKLAAAA
jgi:hypothetical protein